MPNSALRSYSVRERFNSVNEKHNFSEGVQKIRSITEEDQLQKDEASVRSLNMHLFFPIKHEISIDTQKYTSNC